MFYWVLLGFTGFYRILLGFTWFYWVLQGFTGFYLVLLGFTGFYRVLQGFTGFYWVKRDFTGYYWVLLGFAAVFFWVSSDVVGFERKLARLWTTKYCRLDVQWRYCDESERPLSVDSGGTGSAPPQMDCAMVVPVESSFTASCLVLRLVFHNHLFRSFISSSLELV